MDVLVLILHNHYFSEKTEKESLLGGIIKDEWPEIRQNPNHSKQSNYKKRIIRVMSSISLSLPGVAQLRIQTNHTCMSVWAATHFVLYLSGSSWFDNRQGLLLKTNRWFVLAHIRHPLKYGALKEPLWSHHIISIPPQGLWQYGY